MPIKKVTASAAQKKYVPKEGEKDSCILKLHKKEFSSQTGEPLHKPFIFRTDPISYLQFLEFPQGNEIEEVIYLPEGVKTPEQWKRAQALKAKKK